MSEKPALFLVKSGPRKADKRPASHTDEVVPQSGIYRVRHRKHRLPREVTLLRDQLFPRCAKCHLAVIFELIEAVKDEMDVTTAPQICLYELPVLEEDGPIAV